MNIESIRQQAFAMPLTSPAFPVGPYRFADRHIVADLTLGLGEVVFDYLEQNPKEPEHA